MKTLKQTITLFSVFILSACQPGSEKAPQSGSPSESEQVIRIDKLINLTNGLQASAGEAEVITSLSMGVSDTTFDLVKRIVLLNPTEEEKALDIKMLDNGRMVISANTCKATLAPTKMCHFYLRHVTSGLYNGVYSGMLNIGTDAQIQVISTLNSPLYAESQRGVLADLVVDMIQDDFYSFETNNQKSKVLKITNPSSTTHFDPIALQTSFGDLFKVIYSNCSLGLGAKQSCYIRVNFVGNEASQIPAELTLNIASGEEVLQRELITPPVISSFALSGDHKVFSINGTNLKYIKVLKIMDGAVELENMEIVAKSDTLVELHFSQDLTLKADYPYTVVIE